MKTRVLLERHRPSYCPPHLHNRDADTVASWHLTAVLLIAIPFLVDLKLSDWMPESLTCNDFGLRAAAAVHRIVFGRRRAGHLIRRSRHLMRKAAPLESKIAARCGSDDGNNDDGGENAQQ